MTDRRSFTANVLPGRGRGRHLGTPTLNLDLADVPGDIAEGVYACWVSSGQRAAGSEQRADEPLAAHRIPAVLHYGPRPTFGDTRSCEVHLLDAAPDAPPKRLVVEIAGRLRDVRAFVNAEELSAQIGEDIARARAILKSA